MASHPVAESAARSFIERPKGILGCLITAVRSLSRELNREDLSFLASNLSLLLHPLELLQYPMTLCALCASPDHIARRMKNIEHNRSKLFRRPLQFALMTLTFLGLMIVVVPRYLPLPPRYIPKQGFERYLVFSLAMLMAPLVTALLSLVLRVAIVIAGSLIPRKHVINPEAWWAIPFLFDIKTWRRARTPDLFGYLLYGGSYTMLTSGLIACAAYLPFHYLEVAFTNHPGRLTPAESVFMFRLLWVGFWAVVAERVIVNSFTAGLAAMVRPPTYAMTRMILPNLSRHLMQLRLITLELDRVSSVEEARTFAGPLAESWADIECDIAIWRRLHFPIHTDFTKMYPATRSLNTLKRIFGEEPLVLEKVTHLEAVLEGKVLTYFEDGSIEP